MEAQVDRRVRTYGNWRRPRSAGLGQLGSLGTLILLAGMIAVILTSAIFGALPAVMMVIVFGAFLSTLMIRDHHGFTGLQKVAVYGGWWRTRRRRADLYRSGPAGTGSWGTFQLPGLLAASTLSEGVDTYARPFALLRVPSTSHFTVVLACEPDGAALVDVEQIDSWVARWGEWLKLLGGEPGLVAASATIESAPDSGERLRSHVFPKINPAAPAVAREILGDVVDTCPEGAAAGRAWVALTFSAFASGRRKDPAQMANDLAARLPQISHGLRGTGAGAVNPVSAQELCQIVRVAYDPHAQRLFDQAHAAGEEVALSWSDVGPSAAQAEWGCYRHEGAWSVTWAMTDAPRGGVQSNILERFLAPHADIARKRVTLLYRPLSAGVAGRIVEGDVRSATFRATNSPRPSARSIFEQRSAEATAREEADGAGLVNFGMLVTATVLDEQELADADAAIDGLQGTARITLRRAFGSQDSAFAAALPLGIVVSEHLKVPARLRSTL